MTCSLQTRGLAKHPAVHISLSSHCRHNTRRPSRRCKISGTDYHCPRRVHASCSWPPGPITLCPCQSFKWQQTCPCQSVKWQQTSHRNHCQHVGCGKLIFHMAGQSHELKAWIELLPLVLVASKRAALKAWHMCACSSQGHPRQLQMHCWGCPAAPLAGFAPRMLIQGCPE